MHIVVVKKKITKTAIFLWTNSAKLYITINSTDRVALGGRLPIECRNAPKVRQNGHVSRVYCFEAFLAETSPFKEVSSKRTDAVLYAL